MYVPAHFTETDPQAVAALIRDFPLAVVVGLTAGGLVANHLPLLMPEPDRLVGHVARNNAIHRDLAQDQEVLVIFRGEDAYVSPNLYPAKALHHRAVPTWNYQAVHIRGTIRFDHGDKAKRAAVGRLTRDRETRQNGDAAWKMADAPRDYMEEMLGAIVAFDIAVTEVIAKSKLSQNRDDADHAAVRAAMTDGGKATLAARMQARRPDRK